jgi:hypothetical protein
MTLDAANTLVAGVALAVSIAALVIARAQKNQFVHPVGAIYFDGDSGAVVLQNVGTGIMLGLFVQFDVIVAAGVGLSSSVRLGNLAAGDNRTLIAPEFLNDRAAIAISTEIEYENVHGRRTTQRRRLDVTALGA